MRLPFRKFDVLAPIVGDEGNLSHEVGIGDFGRHKGPALEGAGDYPENGRMEVGDMAALVNGCPQNMMMY